MALFSKPILRRCDRSRNIVEIRKSVNLVPHIHHFSVAENTRAVVDMRYIVSLLFELSGVIEEGQRNTYTALSHFGKPFYP